MTEQNPSIFLQAGSHPAEDVRRMFVSQGGWDGHGGLAASTHLAVTEAGTPDMTVDVSGGAIWIPGSEATYQGMYFCENRGTTNLAISASDATNARKDLVVAKVEDAAYSGATNAWSLAVVTGTPAASPSEPTAPANSIVLAMIDVPALDTAITDSQITERQMTNATGTYPKGIRTCLSTARPTGRAGTQIYETDTDRALIHNGTSWVPSFDDAILSIDDSTSSVGIGTTSPLDALDVRGDAHFGDVATGSSAGFRIAIITPGSTQPGLMQKTTDTGAGTITYQQYFRGTTTVGSIATSTTTTTYNTSSDYRLKNDLGADEGSALERLERLRPTTFTFISDPDDGIHEGFIAHEVAEVVPKAVTGEKDAVDDDGEMIAQQLDATKLVPLLVAAVQELTERVRELETPAS